MTNVIVGVVACALGFWGLYTWWWSVVELLRGFAPVALVLFGIIAVGAGITAKRTSISDDSTEEEG
ncbi:magnetosome protein MamI [Deltaproteobacteria bacterium TL4]